MPPDRDRARPLDHNSRRRTRSRCALRLAPLRRPPHAAAAAAATAGSRGRVEIWRRREIRCPLERLEQLADARSQARQICRLVAEIQDLRRFGGRQPAGAVAMLFMQSWLAVP